MIRTVLIDEDKDARETCQEMIARACPEIFILSSLGNPEIAIEIIHEQDPELVISEAAFSTGTVYDLFSEIKNEHFRLLIISVSENNAIDAVKLNAIDYLLKPLEEERLKKALDKAKRLLEQDRVLESWLMSKSFFREEQTGKKLALKTDENIFVIRISQIVYLKATKKAVEFVLEDREKVIVPEVFQKYQQLLIDSGFMKIGMDYLVNCNKVERFDKSDGGYLVLKGPYRIPVNTRIKNQLLATFRRIS